MDAVNLEGVSGEVRLDVSVEGGKYRYVMWDGGSHMFRYDEPWQDALGNKMLYCFAAEVAELREQLATARIALERLSTFEAFTTDGWGFSHPEITARVDFARAALP